MYPSKPTRSLPKLATYFAAFVQQFLPTNPKLSFHNVMNYGSPSIRALDLSPLNLMASSMATQSIPRRLMAQWPPVQRTIRTIALWLCARSIHHVDHPEFPIGTIKTTFRGEQLFQKIFPTLRAETKDNAKLERANSSQITLTDCTLLIYFELLRVFLDCFNFKLDIRRLILAVQPDLYYLSLTNVKQIA